jgi:hypothetical protein
MAFKITKCINRRWPVTVTLRACQEDGTVVDVEQRFIGVFAPFSEVDYLAARIDLFGDENNPEVQAAAIRRSAAEQASLEARLIERFMRGWETVLDDDGNPVMFSSQKLYDLATGDDGPAVRRGLSIALGELRFGLAPAKNADASPEPGLSTVAGEAAIS